MSWNQNRITDMLKAKYPIFQAPMAGGATTVDLISRTSMYGGVGNIGAGYMSPMDMETMIHDIRQKTNHPFGINLFIPGNDIAFTKEEEERAIESLEVFRNELQIDAPLQLPRKDHRLFYEQQLEVVMKSFVPICSFTFGIPEEAVIKELQKEGTRVIGTATSVEEAVLWEERGCDLLVVQGKEAGGHRGTFIGDALDSLIPLVDLIPAVTDEISIPVIAAGGIMDASDAEVAFRLGAEGVQLGTAFLATEESGIHPAYKKMLVSSNKKTSLTEAFSGKWARGIHNRFMEQMKNQTSLPYPLQNDLTQAIRLVAAKQNQTDFMSLWAGESYQKATLQSVKVLMDNLVAGLDQQLDDE
ncbi:nitronate monooxygenase [Cytobacillus sp. FSL W7-1323]|uniref:Probable nitronate monooxygenase n=1 Tax=Cytobacillus kochii TaxID=859143 RepID=A0A248TFX9_9BACI|nr:MULTISPECIES: nitronate monooxygenase [Cytobacillus]ASV67101.1 nitronate monooxygenase [Cytobacillus kochii]MDQ0185371.1 nitronate monooxygenase [Cytobacillus kochii]MEA1854703.1 nitronate monooxygenase [Cytobacillus sp. OWB-43]